MIINYIKTSLFNLIIKKLIQNRMLLLLKIIIIYFKIRKNLVFSIIYFIDLMKKH